MLGMFAERSLPRTKPATDCAPQWNIGKAKRGAWRLPHFAHVLCRGNGEAVAGGSHRKSGVSNGVKNRCPVESYLSFRARFLQAPHTLVWRPAQVKNRLTRLQSRRCGDLGRAGANQVP